MNTKTHEFKVGDKGKTRGGLNYEVIYFSPPALNVLYPMVALVDNQLSIRLKGGQFYESEHPSVNDLMPPVRTVYVNFYGNGSSYSYDSAETAREFANNRTAIAIAVPVELP